MIPLARSGALTLAVIVCLAVGCRKPPDKAPAQVRTSPQEEAAPEEEVDLAERLAAYDKATTKAESVNVVLMAQQASYAEDLPAAPESLAERAAELAVLIDELKAFETMGKVTKAMTTQREIATKAALLGLDLEIAEASVPMAVEQAVTLDLAQEKERCAKYKSLYYALANHYAFRFMLHLEYGSVVMQGKAKHEVKLLLGVWSSVEGLDKVWQIKDVWSLLKSKIKGA